MTTETEDPAMRYPRGRTRAIGPIKGGPDFESTFSDDKLVEDVGFIARIKNPKNKNVFIYIIAGNYGSANLGVVEFTTSNNMMIRHVKSHYNIRDNKISEVEFQAIIKSTLSERIITNTTLEYLKKI